MSGFLLALLLAAFFIGSVWAYQERAAACLNEGGSPQQMIPFGPVQCVTVRWTR